MKTIQLLIAALLTLPSLCLAGPAVSGGDDSKKNYTCSDSSGSNVVIFTDVLGEAPKAGLYLSTGENSTRLVEGLCSMPQNVDEFYLNCAIADSFDIYKVTLNSRGTIKLVSTVKKMESKENQIVLSCSTNEQ